MLRIVSGREHIAARNIDLVGERKRHGQATIGDIEIKPFDQEHGRMSSLGFRFGSFAYSTDVKFLPEHAFTLLDGIDVWIVDALSDNPHPTHSHVEQTLDWIERIGPKRAVLTHLSHRTDYARLAARLPAGVEPGYDGLVIEIPE